ncbi:hypothetical protein D3C72_786250 [compost metagenome]
MDVVPQPGDGQRLRRQDHGIEQLRRERNVPALLRRGHHFGVVATEEGGAHVAEHPVVVLVLCTAGEARGDDLALAVEAVTGHTQQQAVRLHGVDVHVFLALAVPHAALGALRITTTLGQGTVGLGLVLGHRRHVLADQQADQHQYQHRLHHRPDDAPDGNPGSTHDGQFAAAGQAAQADQAADQGSHRQHFVQAPRCGQQDEVARLHHRVGITQVAHLVDEGKQRSQAEDDPQYGEDGQQHALADVAVELTHGPPPHDGRRA